MTKGELYDRVDALERELKLTRQGNSDTTIEYLLTSADALIQAAKVLIAMRDKESTT